MKNPITSTIHDSAYVDNSVTIGHGTSIWHFCHISTDAQIGNNVSIGQNVFIGKGVKIGDNCKIQNNVSVYEGVEIEDFVFCGPSMVFTNVTNPRSEFPRKTEYKTTRVRTGASLGANCTILPGIEIGEHSFIGAGALVSKDTKPFSLNTGVPSKQTGWISRYGEKIPTTITEEKYFKCYKTGDVYTLVDGILKLTRGKKI